MPLMTAACSSTDLLPPEPTVSPDRFTLNVSAPEAYGFGNASRAPEGYNLRLVAALYETPAQDEAAVTTSPQPLSTVETIYNPAGCVLSFDIEKTGKYIVTVFADYIPESATMDEWGHYADKYYDTTQPQRVKVKTTNMDFFNNDLRDCFAGKLVIEKGTAPLQRDLMLKRPVSRVAVSAPGDAVEQLVSRVDVTACSYFGSYSFTLDEGIQCGSLTTNAEGVALAAEEVVIPNVFSSMEPDGKQLFYFYTFGATGADTQRPALGEISFTLSPKENVTLNAASRKIGAGLIRPAQNYQVSVKGGAGWIDASTGDADITVTLNVPGDWGNPETINP